MTEKEVNLDNLSKEDLKNLIKAQAALIDKGGTLYTFSMPMGSGLDEIAALPEPQRLEQIAAMPPPQRLEQIAAIPDAELAAHMAMAQKDQIKAITQKKPMSPMIIVLIALVIIGLFYFLFNRNKFM